MTALNTSTVKKRAKTTARKAIALADSALAMNRQEAIAAVDGFFAARECSIAQLEALKPLLSGHAYRVLEDVIGCAKIQPSAMDWMLSSLRSTLQRDQI